MFNFTHHILHGGGLAWYVSTGG